LEGDGGLYPDSPTSDMKLHPVNGLGGIEGQSPESVNKSIDSLYDAFGWNNDK
jgi:hypothetical protein